MIDCNDKIKGCQNEGSNALMEAVRSQAVVKYSAVQVPVKFNRLECNTNLNLPPSNWLTTSDSSHGLHQAIYQTSGFESFRMAHMFLDCVGDVDVVSDAENIKKLLKLPYTSKGAVSMIVHKVGNTLLIDEFDIQKYLLRKSDDDWKWLRTFILEQTLGYGTKDKNFCLKDKSREAIQTRNLLSKFLYYSLKQSTVESPQACELENQLIGGTRPLPITGPVLPEPKIDENVPDPKSSHVFNRNVVWTFEDIRMLVGTDMPIFGGPNRPCISLRLRDMAKPINVLTGIDYWLDNLMCNVPEVVMCYHLDGIVQKYEIIKTEDLPLIEDSKFSPQVVRNVAQNILSFLKANATKSGHTYWLFKGRNDDVVKLYDLTTLCDNQTTCGDKKENPFTVPVAMLLYSVARNMKNTTARITPKVAGNIRALLDNCIKLLPKEKYPQIVASSHYLLSDLHIPAGIDPKSPKFDCSDVDSDTQSLYDDDDYGSSESDDDFNSSDLSENFSQSCDNFAVKNICDTLKDFSIDNGKQSKRGARLPMPLQATVEERCRISLEHISEGIFCLQFFNSNEEKFIKESEERAKDEEKRHILHEEQHPNMAKPFKPIPLPYASLNSRNAIVDNDVTNDDAKSEKLLERERKIKKQKTKSYKGQELEECAKVDFNPDSKQVAVNFNTKLFGSWNVHLKLLLLEKACLTYATLAEINYVERKFGACLKAIYMAIRCQQVVIKYMSTIQSQKSCLLGRAGDCFFQMAKNWQAIDDYLKEYQEGNEIEDTIIQELERDLSEDDCTDLVDPLRNVEHLMVTSCICYETALECVTDVTSDEDALHELFRRLGNVRNELGLKYMFWAQEEYSKVIEKDTLPEESRNGQENAADHTSKTEAVYMCFAMKSYDSLLRGIAAFSEVQDNVNLAFLYCNMGRFMRFRAHLHISDDIDFVQKQKKFYNEAFSYYEKAKDILGSRKSNIELWDLVNWELSTATFTLAKQLQDFSFSTEATNELEKEVMDLLQKSLKLCDVEHPGSRQILYTFRSGLIHKRIASFHHSQMRNNHLEGDTLPKTTLQLCKLHYEKAASILDSLKDNSELLVVQLERISLQEFLAEITTSNSKKIKHMQVALEICLNCISLFEYSIGAQAPTDTRSQCSSIQASNEELFKYMLLFESRLQNALKTLIKLLLCSKDPKNLADIYKRMYMETLTSKKLEGDQKNQTLKTLAQRYFCVLEKLQQIRNSHNNKSVE